MSGAVWAWRLALCVLLAAGPLRADPRLEARLSIGEPLGELPRFGVNLGGRSVWGAEQLMGNVLRNPGLEAALDGALIIVGEIDPSTVTDDSRWTARPEGFWSGASYEVLSGPAAGQRGRVLDSRRAAPDQPDRLALAPMPAGLRRGDVLALQGQQETLAVPLWWTEGRVGASTDVRPGSPGRRAARLMALGGRPAALFHHLDSIGDRAGKLLPVHGRWRLALWLRAELPGTVLRLSFGRRGSADWLQRELRPGPQWQRHEFDFDARDDGPVGPLLLAIRATAGELLVDDVELGAAGPQGASQPGGFRAELVQTLKQLRPGYLRDWQGQLADTPGNRSATALARAPIRYRPGDHEIQFAYSLPEFLELCAAVQARPWVVLPATSTPAQAREFGQALREGWQRHGFEELVVEHGNEHWNAVFRPAGIADATVLAEVADRAFAALREGAGPAVPLHRVIGTQFVDGAAAGRMAARSRHSEGVAVAPYFHYRQEAGEAPPTLLRRLLHEDIAPLPRSLAETRALGRDLDVYEVNFHTTLGSATPEERNAVVLAPAAGAVLARRLLQAAGLGVRRQAVYTLAGHDSFVAGPGRALVRLFGITEDLAVPARWRATGAALAGLNAVIGGPAHRAACVGAGCAELTALAFDGGRRWALVSSASGPIELQWPCSGAQRLQPATGAALTLACQGGQARHLLSAQSWAVVAPLDPAAGRQTRQ